MGLIEKMKDRYSIEDVNGDLILVRFSDSHRKKLSRYPYKIFLNIGNITINSDTDIEKMKEKGKLIETTEIDIYKEFYNWDEETYHYNLHGCDIRTTEYLDNILKDIGFIKVLNGHKEESMTDVLKINPATYLGKTKDNEWCYQVAYQQGVDNYNIQRIYFKNKPSPSDITIAQEIDSMKFYLIYNGLGVKLTFNCWKCGRSVHWLDTFHNSFNSKLEGLKEKYCGC